MQNVCSDLLVYWGTRFALPHQLVGSFFFALFRRQTALHLSVLSHQHRVCRMLVEAGASLEKVDAQVSRCVA